MKKASTPTTTPHSVKSSDNTRALYASHDHSKDDPENPVVPPEAWEAAVVGKFYRPRKSR